MLRMNSSPPTSKATAKVALAILALTVMPLVWLWPSVIGDRTFVPYDVNQFPPASITATDDELAAAQEHANFDVTEVPVWFAPELKFAHNELREGRLPSWNPHARSGAPLHAHGLIGLCYPPNWLALFAAEPASRLSLVAWCNLAIAGLLAFGLFRHVGFGITSAWLAATCFQLSGPSAANSFFWMRLASFVWLPGVLWPMLSIAKSDRLRPLATIGLAFAFAMTWLAGFPPFAATTTVFAGMLLLWLLVERLVTHGRGHALQLAIKLMIGLALGAAWALPQVMPSLAFFPESARATTPAWTDISGQAFEPYGLLGYLMPDAFGNPTMNVTLPYGQSPMQLLLNTRVLENGNPALPNYNFTEYSVFVSTFGLVLAVIGGLLARGRRAWFARTVLLLALGLGLFWPVLQQLFHLPVVQNVWPFRWPAAATLFVTWLAAAGVERVAAARRRLPMIAGISCLATAVAMWWATGIPEREHRADPDWAIQQLQEHYNCDREAVLNHVLGEVPFRIQFDRFAEAFEQFANDGQTSAAWLGGIGLLLLLLGTTRHARARQALFATAVAASIAQLTLHGGPFLHGAANLEGKDTAVHQFLRDQAEASAATGGFAIVRANSSPRRPDPLPPGQMMVAGVHDLNFYSHGDARTLRPVRMLVDEHHKILGLKDTAGEVLAGKGYLTQSLPAGLLQLPLFDLYGVRYALTTEPNLDKAPHLLGAVVGPVVRGRRQFFVHERPTALPRAFVAYSLEPLEDDDAVLAAITSRTLQPRRQAYVVRSELPTDVQKTTPIEEDRTVTFARNDANHIEIDVAAGKTRHLVLADTYLPGWTATIDGKPSDLIRCNHCQRLVVLPRTACRVTFTYEPPGLMLGVILMLIGTLSAIAACWLLLRRQQRAQEVA